MSIDAMDCYETQDQAHGVILGYRSLCVRPSPDRLYESMNIAGAGGLSGGQKVVLQQLGALSYAIRIDFQSMQQQTLLG
jgi:hypothetical protein